MHDLGLRRSMIGLAIAVRIVAVLVLQSHLVPRSTYEHGEIAENLVAGRGFSVNFLGADGPTSQQAPLYPYLLAAVYKVGGVGTPTSLLILELAQSLLGGWLVGEVMVIAGRVIPDRKWAPLLAGLITALHPTLIYAATHVQVALLAATLLTATLARGLATAESGRIRDAVWTGIFLALLILTDPILGLVAPGVLLAVAMARGYRQVTRLGGIALGVALLGISPWIVRNARVHGEFVFVKSTFGYAFWQGNCFLSEGTDKVVKASVEKKLSGRTDSLRSLNTQLWEARHEAGYLDDVALTKADKQMLGRENEPERSRILFRRALADLKAEPSRYLLLSLRRLRYFFLFDETNPKTRNAIYRLSHLGLSAMALAGLIIAPGTVRKRMLPLVLIVVLIALFHSLTIVSARFHIPIEPILAIFGAGILSRLNRSTTTADDIVRIGVERGFRGSHLNRTLGANGVPQRQVFAGEQTATDHA